VDAVIVMSQTLHLHVVAEGVETESQRDFLERSGCHAFQGFLFSPPVTTDAFERLLVEGQGHVLPRPALGSDAVSGPTANA
jgi:EAL domain-containing protein (putative c-di-GMP-specific phosphodiesterase class I)